MSTFMNIDELYHHIIAVTTNDKKVTDLSFKLAMLKTNSHRVEMVYNILKEYNVFPQLITNTKDTKKSSVFRDIGNDFFRKRMDKEALESYNKAIIFAPLESRELSLAFANRSAVLFAFKQYKECLSDIKNAFITGYDESLKPKLLKRKLMCNEALTLMDPINDLEAQCTRQFRLTKDQHNLVPCASKSIEISYSESMGRSVHATENIAPGEVIVVEEPYCSILLDPFYLQQCFECLKRCDSMIPCIHCCEVMFCSEECRKICWKKSHNIECPLMPLLVAMKFTKLELLALRTVVQTKCTLSGWNELCYIIEQVESETNPLMLGFTKSAKVDSNNKDTRIFDSKNYASVHALVTNIEKRSISDIFQKSVTAAVSLYFLEEYTSFFSEISEEMPEGSKLNVLNKSESVSLTGGLLLLHNMTGPSNMHTISALDGNPETGFVESINFGGGAYPFLSLLNHSCAQNVVRFCSGTTISLVALRPIKKGQQLFDNYGFHHATETIAERQKSLKFQYKFICNCEACTDDWPLYHNLPHAKVNDDIKKELLSHKLLTEDLIDKLKYGDRQTALHIVNQLYPYVCVLEDSAPSQELAEYQETIKQCWSLFGNIIYSH